MGSRMLSLSVVFVALVASNNHAHAQTTLSVASVTLAQGEDIVVTVIPSLTSALDTNTWVGLWPANSDPSALPTPAPFWKYVCSNSQDKSGCASTGAISTPTIITLEETSQDSYTWPITCGEWQAYLMEKSDPVRVSLVTSPTSTATFVVNNAAQCLGCYPAVIPPIPNAHDRPQNGATVTQILFGSCFKPYAQKAPFLFWPHVRNLASRGATIWNWLGDNMYSDGVDMNIKRLAYNDVRLDAMYTTYGPMGVPKIPTTGVWDDHDFGVNNFGNNYPCRLQAQNEYAIHFNISSADPRHPAQGARQQQGIYHAFQFARSATNASGGIHLINLDNRFHRDPTYREYGPCQGAASTMLGNAQWAWLANELGKRSDIKIIGSGIQVLPPTSKSRDKNDYCAYDGPGGTFDRANAAVGEGDNAQGTDNEAWAEIPQERTKLLLMVQKALHLGYAKKVIFVSGDQHWAEIMTKTLPKQNGMKAATVYEVTASGIDDNWPFDVPNSNRFEPGKVSFPVVGYKEATQNNCTQSGFHICSANNNYGAIDVDFAQNIIKMTIFTPTEKAEDAASLTIAL